MLLDRALDYVITAFHMNAAKLAKIVDVDVYQNIEENT